MTKEEILERIEKGVVDQTDLFDYYKVKNSEGLEMAIEEKIKKVKVNLEYLNGAFEFIFTARTKEAFNPLEEKFYFYSMLFPSLYGVALDEVNIIVRSLGLFQSCFMFDKIFENKSEYKYFQKLYQMFIDTKNSPRVLVDEYFNKVSTLVKNSIEELNIEKLQKVSDSIFEELNKVKNGNE
jgi:hypothetical protein